MVSFSGRGVVADTLALKAPVSAVRVMVERAGAWPDGVCLSGQLVCTLADGRTVTTPCVFEGGVIRDKDDQPITRSFVEMECGGERAMDAQGRVLTATGKATPTTPDSTAERAKAAPMTVAEMAASKNPVSVLRTTLAPSAVSVRFDVLADVSGSLTLEAR